MPGLRRLCKLEWHSCIFLLANKWSFQWCLVTSKEEQKIKKASQGTKIGNPLDRHRGLADVQLPQLHLRQAQKRCDRATIRRMRAFYFSQRVVLETVQNHRKSVHIGIVALSKAHILFVCPLRRSYLDQTGRASAVPCNVAPGMSFVARWVHSRPTRWRLGCAVSEGSHEANGKWKQHEIYWYHSIGQFGRISGLATTWPPGLYCA